MELNFGRSAPFSLGVEEELQLVSAESYDLVSRYDEVAAAAGDERVKPELMQSTAEVVTGVARTVGEAMIDVAELRERVAAAAAEGVAGELVRGLDVQLVGRPAASARRHDGDPGLRRTDATRVGGGARRTRAEPRGDPRRAVRARRPAPDRGDHADRGEQVACCAL